MSAGSSPRPLVGEDPSQVATPGLALLGGGTTIRGRIAAVGEPTAATLEAAGIDGVLRPVEGASSEALLALPELSEASVAGSRIVIVRGAGGRPVLADTLSKRGAEVAYAEVYRRGRPEGDPAGVAELGAAGGIDVVVVTSVEGLENLFSMLDEASAPWLQELGYVVASERIGARARGLGVAEMPLVAAGADDEAVLEALLRWRGKHRDTGT